MPMSFKTSKFHPAISHENRRLPHLFRSCETQALLGSLNMQLGDMPRNPLERIAATLHLINLCTHLSFHFRLMALKVE